MSNKQGITNRKIKMHKDSIVGMLVLSGIALIVAVVILKDGNEKPSGSIEPSDNVLRVIDGDTIEVNLKKIRLFGIDAPEKGQPCTRNNKPYDCGRASKEHLIFITAGANIECDEKGKDKWGRIIGACTADGEDIGRLMVKHGWAVAYTEYSGAYLPEEKFARTNRLGVWSKEFSIPSEWRKSDRGDRL